jgi:hypothetical protein
LKIHHIKQSLTLSENVFKKNQNLEKSLKFSANIFKRPRILKKSLAFSKKALRQLPQWPVRPCCEPFDIARNLLLEWMTLEKRLHV